MPATPRQKACNACADSKRRCDKQVPECQRCLDRDVDCVYPQPKRRRRDPIAADDLAQELINLQNENDPNDFMLGNGLSYENWDTMVTAGLDQASLTDLVIPYIPTPSAAVANASNPSLMVERDKTLGALRPWFLQDETWVMQPATHDPACVTFVQLEPFLRDVEEMLRCWVINGYNSFIHRRLYSRGMPTCLQDAFTALAAYNSRTPTVKDTILQIADERASTLVLQSTPTINGLQGMLAHLSRVQALFVYEFMRLFDGSVRMRTSAEQQLQVLRQWVAEMWETAKQYQSDDVTLGRTSLRWDASEFDKEYETSSEMWRLWILIESVRRTQLVVDTTLNTYQVMTNGWAECAGAIMFTARRGLWEAESAMKWRDLCSVEIPLLASSLSPEPLISKYAAEEFDDFATMYWTYIVGKDKIQCWIDKGNNTNRT